MKFPLFHEYISQIITKCVYTCWHSSGAYDVSIHEQNWHQKSHATVPDTASYIRGWIQMVRAPNDIFSWNNKYNKYIEYNITDTFTCFFLAMHTTYSVHAGLLKPWRGRLPWPLVVFSFYHVFPLPLSGSNWRSLFPPWGSGPRFLKMAPPFTGSAHTPLPGSGTATIPNPLF